jgi:hypothetical protein
VLSSWRCARVSSAKTKTNPNGLSTGVVRVKDATIAVNNKPQRFTDAISSFKETLPSS